MRGVGATMLLLKPVVGQISKLAVSVKYATFALTTPGWSRLVVAAWELLSVHR